jgi:chromosome segregation ATPase
MEISKKLKNIFLAGLLGFAVVAPGFAMKPDVFIVKQVGSSDSKILVFKGVLQYGNGTKKIDKDAYLVFKSFDGFKQFLSLLEEQKVKAIKYDDLQVLLTKYGAELFVYDDERECLREKSRALKDRLNELNTEHSRLFSREVSYVKRSVKTHKKLMEEDPEYAEYVQETKKAWEAIEAGNRRKAKLGQELEELWNYRDFIQERSFVDVTFEESFPEEPSFTTYEDGTEVDEQDELEVELAEIDSTISQLQEELDGLRQACAEYSQGKSEAELGEDPKYIGYEGMIAEVQAKIDDAKSNKQFLIMKIDTLEEQEQLEK